MKKTVIVLTVLALLFVSLPVSLFAEADPCLTAKTEAAVDANHWLWIGAGCVFGVFGVLAGMLIDPQIPPNRIIGKTPEYVTSYSVCYVQAGKDAQFSKSIAGCSATVLMATLITSAMMMGIY